MSQNTKQQLSTQRDELPNHNRHYALVSFLFVCIVIGVPVWIKTTETYRAPIPYAELETIRALSYNSSDYCTVRFITTSPNISHYHNQLKLLLPHTGIESHFIDAKLSANSSEHDVKRLLEEQPAQPHTFSLGTILLLDDPTSTNGLWSVSEHSAVVNGPKTGWQGVSHALRSLLVCRTPHTRTYDVLVTFLVAPSTHSSVTMAHAHTTMRALSTLAAQLAPLLTLRLRLQHVYEATLGVHEHRARAGDGTHVWYVHERHLALNMHTIEWRLGVHNKSHALHLVIYFPAAERQPFLVRTDAGQWSSGLLLSGWGALHMCAAHAVRCSATAAVTQLSTLLGLQSPGQQSPWRQSLVHWQTRACVCARTRHNWVQARDTLLSLARMLQTLPTIVLEDRVAASLSASLRLMERSRQLARAGEMTRASHVSQQARDSAHVAMYHPSMLALLYFPDNQKYAIYIPLFLPVALPIVVTIVHYLRVVPAAAVCRCH